MGTRQNIGIYIGPDDLDIAAWFNMLQENGMSRAKWARGLFAAYALSQPLDIGTITLTPAPAKPVPKPTDSNLLFGVGSSQKDSGNDRYGYGWHIRGPNREFVQGSVINVSVRKDEVLPIINMVWSNGHQLATFFKALIRQNLKYGDKNIPPKFESLQKVYSEFMVSQATEKVSTEVPERKKRMKKPKAESPKRKEPAIGNPEPKQSDTPKREAQAGARIPGKAIHFPTEPEPVFEPEPEEQPRTKNVLLNQIF